MLGTIVSHLVAERPWRLAFDPGIIAQSLRFGWPLLANAILMFLIFQGDKMIVGRELGMEMLAIFAMGLTLTLTPTLVIAKSVQNLMLPKLSAAENSGSFARLGAIVFEVHVLLACIMVFFTALFGHVVVATLLGSKYDMLTSLLVWLALQQGLRISKGGPSMVALSKGQTENAFIANMMRIALIPLAWFIVVRGGDILTVVQIGICGELAGLIVALGLQRWRQSIHLSPILPMLLFALSAMALSTAWVEMRDQSWLLCLAGVFTSLSALCSRDLLYALIRQKK